MKLGDRISVHIDSSGSLVAKSATSFKLPATIIGVYTHQNGMRQFYLACGIGDTMVPSGIPMLPLPNKPLNGGGYQYLADISSFRYAAWLLDNDPCLGKVLNDVSDMAVVVSDWVCSLSGCKKSNNAGDKICYMCGNTRVK
jgi:hypothetical protein